MITTILRKLDIPMYLVIALYVLEQVESGFVVVCLGRVLLICSRSISWALVGPLGPPDSG